jgi:hypothetical protein
VDGHRKEPKFHGRRLFLKAASCLAPNVRRSQYENKRKVVGDRPRTTLTFGGRNPLIS